MADHDAPRVQPDVSRLTPRRQTSPRDSARVAETDPPTGLKPAGESRYGAASASPRDASIGQRGPDRSRAIVPRLTAPDIVPITEKQHRQAVDILAAMIVSWVERNASEPADEGHTP
jgi:hypothetical protein